MTNRDSIRRHLAIIDDNLGSLEYYCETEIVGEDTRHLLCDIKGAQRQHVRTDADAVEESWDIKPLYDRLKSIQTSLRVLRNNLDLSDKAIEKALESCNAISAEVDKPEDDEL
jgi:hypothetical protein